MLVPTFSVQKIANPQNLDPFQKTLFAFPGIPKIYRDFYVEKSLESLINKGFHSRVRLDYEEARHS